MSLSDLIISLSRERDELQKQLDIAYTALEEIYYCREDDEWTEMQDIADRAITRIVTGVKR